ncbi:MAG: DUF1859 domain-containing protein [Nitrososphaera sp.]
MPTQARKSPIPFFHNPQVNEEDGARVLPLVFDFSSDTVQEFSMPLSDVGLFSVQTVYIDNGGNANAVTLTIRGTNQRIIVSPNSQGYYALLASPQALDIIVEATAGIVRFHFINIAMIGQLTNWKTV